MYQINTLCILNLHNSLCQLSLSKKEIKKYSYHYELAYLHHGKFGNSRNAENESNLLQVFRHMGPSSLPLLTGSVAPWVHLAPLPTLSPPPPPFCFLKFILLSQAPPCVPAVPIPTERRGHFCGALSPLCHCCAPAGSHPPEGDLEPGLAPAEI